MDGNIELKGYGKVESSEVIPHHGTDTLARHTNLLMKQTAKGWFQNLLGCESTTEMKIATMEHKEFDIFYALEESSCCMRICFPGHHPFQMRLSTGAAPGGDDVASYARPCACNIHPLKCCCFQRMDVFDPASDISMGSFKETFWTCVPAFAVTKPDNTIEYKVHMPICWGCLPDCCAEGLCSCRIPFYIFDPIADGTKEARIGKIVKIFASWNSELIGAHQFEIEFPPDADPEAKARLLGGAFLLNELFFKRHKRSS